MTEQETRLLAADAEENVTILAYTQWVNQRHTTSDKVQLLTLAEAAMYWRRRVQALEQS